MIIKKYLYGEYASSFASNDPDKIKMMCKDLDDPNNDIAEFYTEDGEKIFFWRRDGKIHGNLFNYPEEDIPESAIANGYVKMECPFCRDYSMCTDNADYYKKKDVENKFKSALVHESYYQGEKTGQSSFGNHPLHFCPTCGKEISKPKTVKLLFDKEHYNSIRKILVEENGFPITVFLSNQCIELSVKDFDLLGKALPNIKFQKF